jgi:predicted nuclease of predicted toxin-antitoxin system
MNASMSIKFLTKDADICKYADENDFVVITKDADFRDFHFIKKTPRKLIKINLGNISNKELKDVLSQNNSYIQKASQNKSFLIEISRDDVYLIKD